MTRAEMRSVLRRWGKSKERLKTLNTKAKEIFATIDTIEGLQAVNMDGMPRSGVGHPTEARALRSMAYKEDKEAELTQIYREMDEIEKADFRIESAIIIYLTDRQEQVIREMYQIGGTHEQVAERLRIEPRVLRKRETLAIDKLIEELEK